MLQKLYSCQKLIQLKTITEQNNTLKNDLQKKTQASLSSKTEISKWELHENTISFQNINQK